MLAFWEISYLVTPAQNTELNRKTKLQLKVIQDHESVESKQGPKYRCITKLTLPAWRFQLWPKLLKIAVFYQLTL